MNVELLALDDLAPGARVVVGCSGGADSLALLVLACRAGFSVDAVYVDHGLRAGTEHEADVVRQAADRFGARDACRIGRRRRGREPRGAAHATRGTTRSERVRAEVGAEAILVAHTRDDQAETVLLNFLRGSGTAGLAGDDAAARVRSPAVACDAPGRDRVSSASVTRWRRCTIR